MTPGGPETDADPVRTVDGPLYVVMPSSFSRTSTRLPSVTIPVHLPFAIVPMQNLSTENGRHIDFKVTDKDGNDQAIFLFSREHLSFSARQDATLTFPQSNPTPGERPTNDNDATDVNWIADMRKIWPQASTIQGDCLPTSTVFPRPATVAAQLTVGGGTIKTKFPSQEHPIVTFHPDKGVLVSQAITRQFVVEQDLPDDDFELRSESLDADAKGVGMTPIAIHPVTGTNLTITIGNADFEDILAIAAGSVSPSTVAVDVDFELYRPILNTPDNSTFPVPVIIGRQAGHDNCPGVRTGTTTPPGGGS